MGILEALITLFSERKETRRKLIVVFVLTVLSVSGLVVFEHYTSWLRLNRLQKATVLMAGLQDIQARGTNMPAEFERMRVSVTRQAIELIEPRPTLMPSIPRSIHERLSKFFAGSAFWWLAALIVLTRTGKSDGKKSLVGNLLIAVASGLLAIALPTFWWPWFHLVLYPILFVTLVLVPVTLLYALWMALKRAKERAQEISCTSNLKQVGLAARLFANDHQDFLPKDLDSMTKELVNEKITRCPKDRTVRYKILSPGISEADPSVVYAQCPLHKSVVLADGSAHSLKNNRLVREDGKLKIKFGASTD